MKRVLVIKLAALGDFVQAVSAMERIRAAHPQAELTLLTTPPYAGLAQASGLFDRIETDGRPKRLRKTFSMLRRLRRARYDRVYDLQTSSRSSAYFHALRPCPPEWSGIAWGASHPHANAARDAMHTLERQAEQLRDAGIWPDAPTAPGEARPPVLTLGDREREAARHFGLHGRYALLVPGASPARPRKRWPAERYGELAQVLVALELQVAVLGSSGEAAIAATIRRLCPEALDLTGRTDFAQVAALGASAALSVGNDTGPMHLVAAAGAPSLVLFSREFDPALCAPRGTRVVVLQAAASTTIPLETVVAQAKRLLPPP